MRHMRKLKMQWHGDPASVDKNVAYKDKASIWFQKSKDLERANSTISNFQISNNTTSVVSYNGIMRSLNKKLEPNLENKWTTLREDIGEENAEANMKAQDVESVIIQMVDEEQVVQTQAGE